MSTKKDENKIILPDISSIKTQDTFTLPSKGLIYDESENIPASITLRRMTTKEDKMRMRNLAEDKIRRDILQACTVDQGVNIGRLKLADANYLLFKLRVLSLLDDKYKVQITCPGCGSLYVHEVHLNDVEVDYFTKKKLDTLVMELPLSKSKIEFKFPSLDDMINMGDKLRSYFEKFPNADKAEAIYTTSAMLYVKKVNGESLISEELEDFLDNMDIIDNRYFRQKLMEIDELYGLDQDIACECPTCKTPSSHGLPITSELFSPSF